MKKLIDDAKRKAAEAKDRAQEEAGKAMAKALVGQAEKRVAAVVDGWLDSAEQALSDAEGEVAARRKAVGLDDDADGDEASEAAEVEGVEVEGVEVEGVEVEAAAVEAEEEPEGPSAEEREAALRERLALLKAERAEVAAGAPEPAAEVATEPAVVSEPEPAWTPPPPRDPYAEAEAVLQRAAAARGAESVTADRPLTPDLADPFAAAEAALTRAREARIASGTARHEPEPVPLPRTSAPRSVDDVLARAAEAREMASKGRGGMAREAEARKALAAMKAARGGVPPSADSEDEDDTPTETGPAPRTRKRTL